MRFIPNPAFESELKADPRNKSPVKNAAEDAADVANHRIRKLYRTNVITPFMPRGGFGGRGRKRGRARAGYAAKPVHVMRDPEGEIYITNFDHAAVMIEFGGAYTTGGRRLGPVAPLRVGARRNARLTDRDQRSSDFTS